MIKAAFRQLALLLDSRCSAADNDDASLQRQPPFQRVALGMGAATLAVRLGR
jgi:hypothetical protein